MRSFGTTPRYHRRKAFHGAMVVLGDPPGGSKWKDVAGFTDDPNGMDFSGITWIGSGTIGTLLGHRTAGRRSFWKVLLPDLSSPWVERNNFKVIDERS